MFVVESSAVLPHPPDVVYAAIASIESLLRWQAGVRAVRRPPAMPPAARSRGPVVLTYRALGVGHALTARVLAAESPHLFAYRAEGAAFALEARYRVEPAPGGAHVVCRVALDTTASRQTADCVALRRLLARRVVSDLTRLDRWVAARGCPERPGAAPLAPRRPHRRAPHHSPSTSPIQP